MLARAFSLIDKDGASAPDADITPALRYADHNQIAEWALASVAIMTKKGYISGRPGNLFAPRDDLSRSEALKMIDNIMGELINAKGTYTRKAAGNMVVSSQGVTLQDTQIEGDLYLTDGIGQDPVRLVGVTVKGRMIISGSLTGKVIVISGDFEEIMIGAPGANIMLESGTVGRVVVGRTGAGAVITAKDGTTVDELVTYAGADITGGRNIINAVIASGGVTMDEKPQSVTIADGGKAVAYSSGSGNTAATGGGGASGGGGFAGGGSTGGGTPGGGSSGGGQPGGGSPGGGGTSGGDPGNGSSGEDSNGGGSSGPGDPDTRIRVLPGVNVEVGEEVYFDGAYYLGEYDESVQWEWDFGDGYTLKAGEPKNTTFDTGLCVIHYFMRPGTYEVRLNVSRFDMSKSPPVRQELLHTDSVTVHVSGEAPMEGFELRHAPFHARTAQYLYAVVPPGYSPNQVSVRLESPEGNLVQALSGVTEDGKQRFLLENAKLPAGDYVVVAELKNGKEPVSTIRERFSKPYDGAPEIGINENNAFVLNGNDLFFPIGPWLLDKDSIPMWRSASNTLFAMGYYPVRDEDAWSDYINAADSKDMKAIGPVGWKEFNKRNSSPDIMTGYIETSKGLNGLLGWCWDDEPNLGGRYGCVPATVTAAWSYWTGLLDPQHPTVQQYYGYDYLPHYHPREQEHGYSYMRNANLFGGKKAFTADFITFDIYPIEYKEHASLNYDSRGVIDLWAEAMDTFSWNMDDLIPLGTFVETQNVTTWDRMSNNKYETEWDAGPTPGDLRTQLWTAIVHNMKAVFYFNHFAETPMDNMSVLNEFNEAVTDLAPVILAPPSSHTVTHNCHKRGQRVDLMVRETTTDYYIFAVRVTEPESEWGEVPEPDNIEFVLNTGTQATVAYDILPGYSWEYGLFDVTEAKKTFHFDLKEGIKPGSVLISVADKVTGVIPEKLVDRWTDKEYSAVLDKQGVFANGYDDGAGKIVPIHSFKNIKRGTIDYDTGEVNVEFNNNVPQGESYIQIAYAVNDRPVRTLTGTGGVFRDTLERNAVRIYRIPKDQH